MTTYAFFAVVICAAFAALNLALYAANHSPVNLGAGIFCGSMAVLNLVIGQRR